MGLFNSNKDRLYVALYYSKGEDVYHWALLVSPKTEGGSSTATTQYQISNKLLLRGGGLHPTWEYEKQAVAAAPAGSEGVKPFARILIGKVKGSKSQFETSVEKVEITQDNPAWTDKSWVKAAIAQLLKDGVLDSGDGAARDWAKIEKESLSFAEKKKAEGRFDSWAGKAPTYDLILKRETVK